MRWLRQTFAVTGAQPPDDSAAAELVGASPSSASPASSSSSSRCCRSPKDSRRRCGSAGSPRSRARHAQRRRQRDDERPRRPEVDIIKQAPGIRRDGQTPLASAELFVDHRPAEEVDAGHAGQRAAARRRADGARGPRRGDDRRGPDVRVRHQRGHRRPRRQRAVRRPGGRRHDSVSGQNTWQVVGIFEADGGVAETEIWCDARALQGAYRRGNTYQSVLARLDSPASFDTFKDWLTANPQVNVMVRRETDYYAGAVTSADEPHSERSASASRR